MDPATKSRHSNCLGLSLQLLELDCLAQPSPAGIRDWSPRFTTRVPPAVFPKLVQRAMGVSRNRWEGSTARPHRL
jgi:hypothetical protein